MSSSLGSAPHPGDAETVREALSALTRGNIFVPVAPAWEALARLAACAERSEALEAALAFWVARADRFEANLGPNTQYMKARGVLNENYAIGRAALAASPGDATETERA